MKKNHPNQYTKTRHGLPRLKLRLRDPLANLVEFKLSSGPQSFLKRSADLDSRHSTAKLERQLLVVEHTLGELVALSHERRAKAIIVSLCNLTPNTIRLVVLDQVVRRVLVDSELAVCTDDLGDVVLTSGHHTRSVEVGYAAAPEFDDADAVVDVLVLCEARVAGVDAYGADGLDDAVGAEEPECQVDVVDCGVDEDAAGVLGVGDEVLVIAVLVACLRTEDGWASDATVVGAFEGCSVAGVEAA